jgi:hypothetical protein
MRMPRRSSEPDPGSQAPFEAVGRCGSAAASREKDTQDDRADERAWSVSWISIQRIDQYPGRDSAKTCRAESKPVR